MDDEGRVDWRVVVEPAATRLIGRCEGTGCGVAMAEALNALLREIRS